MSATADLTIGDGVFSLPAAATILRHSNPRMTQQRVRAWAHRGVTYGPRRTDAGMVLSFADLVSLEVEGRLRRAGLTSQGVRRLEHRLGQLFPTWDHPLARGVFFTHGQRVWAGLDPEREELLEVIGKRRDQYVMGAIVRPFCQQVTFDPEDLRALRWDLNEWIEVNPAVQFGEPVVKGTRTPVATIAANLRVGSPAEVAGWYGLTVEQILGIQDYLAAVS